MTRPVVEKCKVDIVWPTSGINLYKYRIPPSFIFQQVCQDKRQVFQTCALLFLCLMCSLGLNIDAQKMIGKNNFCRRNEEKIVSKQAHKLGKCDSYL